MPNDIDADTKFGYVLDAYDASIAAVPPITLYAQLRQWQTAQREAVGTGSTVASTSAGNAAGSRSVSFFPPNIGGIAPDKLLSMLGELVRLHDTCMATLGLTNTTGNRDAIKNEMVYRLVPITELQIDHTCLRFG